MSDLPSFQEAVAAKPTGLARRLLQAMMAATILGAVIMVSLPGGRALLVGAVNWLRSAGSLGQLTALAAVLVGIPLGVPTVWLAALIGYLFGVALGLPTALVGVSVGAVLTFLLARWLLREDTERLLATRPRWRAIVHAVGTNGTRMVVLLRIAGPHNILNVLLATSTITVRQFALGTFLGCIPSVSLATVGGALAPDAGALWEASASLGPARPIFIGVGLLALVATVVLVRRAAERALERSTLDAARETGPAGPSLADSTRSES